VPEPGDPITLLDVLAGLEQEGFTGQLVPTEDGLTCTTCGTTTPAERFDVEHFRRLEGASDPDDMSAVVAARCPECGSAGTVVLQYGPSASSVDAETLRRLDLRHHPGEAA
jgi:hypothetical protein